MFPNEVEIQSSLLFEWLELIEQIKPNNLILNKRCGELVEHLSLHGKESCILKGQGNALMYSQPSLRVSGDIDVWRIGSEKEIVEFVQKWFPKERVQYHHIHYRMFM